MHSIIGTPCGESGYPAAERWSESARGSAAYSELKGHLDGKRDHNLTMALGRLRRDGLVDQRIDASTQPPVKSYELSNLGIQVVLRMHEMIPAHVSAQTLLRGKAAASA